jgi:hypothetical protein
VSATAIPVVNAGKRDMAIAIMRGVMRCFVFFTPVFSLNMTFFFKDLQAFILTRTTQEVKKFFK